MLASFLMIAFLSACMIGGTGLITYEVLRLLWAILPRLRMRPRLRILAVIGVIFALHILNIWLYAGAYLGIETWTDFGVLTGDIQTATLSYASFVERLYFSASTYASLGLGDIRPTRDLRMLVVAEVLNGLILIGWSISFTYLTMEKFWATRRDHGQ